MTYPDNQWPGVPKETISGLLCRPDELIACPKCGDVPAAEVSYDGVHRTCETRICEEGDTPWADFEPDDDVAFLAWCAKGMWKESFHARIPERLELVAEQLAGHRAGDASVGWRELCNENGREIVRLRELLTMAVNALGLDKWHEVRHAAYMERRARENTGTHPPEAALQEGP